MPTTTTTATTTIIDDVTTAMAAASLVTDDDGAEATTPAADGLTGAAWIAAASCNALRERLESLGLCAKGSKDSLKKRLRAHLKSPQPPTPTTPSSAPPLKRDPLWQPFDFYLVFDVEATCDAGVVDRNAYPNEIIEFPIILICGRTLTVIDEFHRFVRPTLNPILSEFCTSLTGITQDQVDGADTFPQILVQFEEWLETHTPRPFLQTCRFITDGPWDIRDFIVKQCNISQIPRPTYFFPEKFGSSDRRQRRGNANSSSRDLAHPRFSYIDLRRLYHQTYGLRENLVGMLAGRGLEFAGRQHSGLDDARNIARIVLSMMEDGVVFK